MINSLRDRYEALELYLAVRTWVTLVKIEERRRGRRAIGGLRKCQDEWRLALYNAVPDKKNWAVDRWSIGLQGSIDDVARLVINQEKRETLPSTSWYDEHKPTRATA